MKILFVTYRLPYPPFSGERLRFFQLMQILLKKYQLWLISFVTSETEIEKVKELENLGIQVQYIKLNTRKAKLRAIASLIMTPNIPMQVAYYTNRDMQNLISNTIEQEKIDVTYICLARMGQYFIPNSSSLQILDYMDAFSEYYHSRSLIAKNLIPKILDRIEAKRLKQWEQKIYNQYDRTTIISPHDAVKISELSPPIVIPGHINDYLDFQTKLVKTESPGIIFFGEMSTYYSENAVNYAVEQILPKVWGKVPDVKFYVVGANPTDTIIALASDKVIVTGYVDDVREYIHSADISIAPLNMGSGLKYKIIQSMAMQVPVVCSSIANLGIQAEHNKHLLIAETPEYFAESIIYLLNNPQYRNGLVNNALQFVKKNFSRETIDIKLNALLNEFKINKKET